MESLIPTTHTSLAPASEVQSYAAARARDFSGQFDVRRIFMALASRKLLILIATLVVMIPGTIYTFLVTPTYVSTAVVQIEPEAVKVLPYNSVSDSVFQPSRDYELYMKTQDELLRSPTLMMSSYERAAKEYKARNPPRDQLMIRGDFGAGMQIRRIDGSQIVKISYISFEPEFSALAANIIAEEFMRLHFERKIDTTRKANEFLETQLAALRKKVEQAEADLIEYARRNKILDTDSNQVNVIRQRFGLLSADLARAQASYIARQAELQQIQGITPEEFPESLRSPAITSLETTVIQNEQDLSRLLTQFGENWPQVIQKRKDLAVAREQLLQEKRAAIARAKRDAQIRLSSIQHEYEMLNQTLKEQQLLVDRLSEAGVQFNNLKRELDASQQLYQGLLQRLNETGVSPGLEFENIRIVDRAQPGRVPYQPKKLWNISLLLLLGLSAGMGLALLLEYLDRSLKNAIDLEVLGLPMLGWIPAMKLRDPRKAAIQTGNRKKLASIYDDAGSSGARPLPVLALKTMDVRARESYRSIVASLLLSRPAKPPRCVLITSSTPREGKTLTCVSLGRTLAEGGFRTLLIDSDFRNPSLSRWFGVANGCGLSTHLAGGEINVRDTHVPNLFVLSAGPTPPNPVALLSAPRLSECLAALKQEFQFVLIDGAPVLSVADASILASKVDGVILIVRAGVTPKEVVARANLSLVRSRASILGAALNYVDLKNPEYSFYRKYYYSEPTDKQQPA
ncbi:MAG: polysaccharide biosynthesis tyrosine autokinase [Acidobacteria bacterium]|nr:polysaccharide biosynthesis tyrosine autokinase [Acidobacteriota bacterium]